MAEDTALAIQRVDTVASMARSAIANPPRLSDKTPEQAKTPIIPGARLFQGDTDGGFRPDKPKLVPGTYDSIGYSTHAWTYAAISAIVSHGSRAPWGIRRKRDKAPLEGHPAQLIIEHANPVQGSRRLFGTTLLNAELWSESFWNMEMQGGKLVNLWPIPPLQMKLTKTTKGVPEQYTFTDGKGDETKFPASEIMWFRHDGPGNWLSTAAPMSAAAQAVQTDLYSIRTQEKFFEAGHHAFALTTDQEFDSKKVDALRTQWTESYKGLQSYYKPAILHSGLGVTDIGRTPGAEQIELRKQLRQDVLAVFGVPPAVVGLYESANFGVSIEVQRKMFWTDALMGKLDALASDMNAQLVERIDDAAEFYWMWDKIPALKPDFTALLPPLVTAVGGPFTTVNEARAILEMEPLDDEFGDVYYTSFNQIPTGPGAVSQPAPPPAELEPAVEIEDQAEELEEDIEPDDEERAGRWTVQKGLRRLAPHARFSHWKAFNTRRIQEQRKLTVLLGPVFDALAKEIIANIEESETLKAHQRIADPRVEALLFTEQAAAEGFTDVVLPFITALAGRAGQQAIASVGLDIVFSPDTTRMQEILVQRKRFMKSVGERVQNTARTALSEGLAAGETVADLTKRVEAFAANGKRGYAQAVARTEVGITMNAASMEGYSQAGATHKEWLSVIDDNSRGAEADDLTNHIELDGEIIPAEAQFELESPLGVEFAFAPMDPSLSAANIVNCRCTSAAVFQEEFAP